MVWFTCGGGRPEFKGGYDWTSDRSGLGIELDERLAAKFPIKDDPMFDLKWETCDGATARHKTVR